MDKIGAYVAEQISNLLGSRTIPEFKAGDTVRVNFEIIEGTTKRVQAFEGLCIARKSNGLGSSFKLRKMSHGFGVERTFPLYSNRIQSIEVVKHGLVRRGKLFYMRNLRGKAARIKEDMSHFYNKKAATKAAAEAKQTAASAAPATDASTSCEI